MKSKFPGEPFNARIVSTSIEIHSDLLTYFIYLKFGEDELSIQAFGGHALKDTAVIYRILQVIGVRRWEDLPGKYVRVIGDRERLYDIGNIVDERWFSTYCEAE